MITAEDLALAQRLIAEGKVNGSAIERCLASLAGANAGKPLRQVLEDEGVITRGGFAVTREAGGEANRVTAVPSISAAGKKIGRYEIESEVARGGMGIVYRAREPGLNRAVALKVLIAGQHASADQVERFLREARAAAGLSHPNIVPVYEVGNDSGTHFFAMEFVEGLALDKLMKRDGALPPRIALRIARDLARALQHAHEKGIVHRDVKPGNVFMAGAMAGGSSSSVDGKALRVLLGDFGLARDTTGTSLTISGNLLGTPAYMSPEQAAGKTAVDARSDVFSLGAVLYEMLAGRPPFRANALADLLSAIQRCEPEALRHARPGIHRDVEVIVHQALAREPDRRYQSAAGLADDIDRYLNGEAITAAAPSFAYRATRWARRRMPVLVAASVMLAALATAGIFLAVRASRQRQDAIHRRESARSELVRRASERVARARGLGEEGKWDDAFAELRLACEIVPDFKEAAQAGCDLRRGRALKELRSLVAKADASDGDWDLARALLATSAEFASEPEFLRLARAVAGTCTMAVDSDEPGVEIDLGRAEPEIWWDEESFPSMSNARALGLCKPIGAAPLEPMDMEFGDWYAVFSREGRPLRVIPMRLTRGTHFRLHYRVLRVGSSPAATHPTITKALAEITTAGGTILLEDGEHAAPTEAVPGGTLIASLPGVRAVIVAPTSSALACGGFAGCTLRDLVVANSGSRAFTLSGEYRPAVIRCSATGGRDGGLGAGNTVDLQVRSSRFSSTSAFSVDVHDKGVVLFVDNDADGGDWYGSGFVAEGLIVVRCNFQRPVRAGLRVETRWSRISGCTFRDCPEWGVLFEGSENLDVHDCLFVRASTVVVTQSPGALAVAGASGGTVTHNTFVASAGPHCTFDEAPVRFADNILADALDYKRMSGDSVPGMAFWLRTRETAIPEFGANLVHGLSSLGRFRLVDYRKIDDLRIAVHGAIPGEPPLPGLRLVGADPEFLDPASGDFHLAPDSPARGAAGDGDDFGVRWAKVEADTARDAAWIKQQNGRTYLRQAKGSLEAGRRDEARALAAKAEFLLPGDSAVAEFLGLLR